MRRRGASYERTVWRRVLSVESEMRLEVLLAEVGLIEG